MPRYIVSVRKGTFVGENVEAWTNRYHVDAADLESALDLGVSIANIEQAVYKDYVFMSRVTAIEDQADPPPGGSRLLTGSGDVTGDATLRLPTFNTVRITFSDGNGRPSQKYLRLPLEEGDIQNGTITTALNNALTTNYVGPLLSLSGLVSNSGDPFTEGDVIPAIQMRQTSWKRRSREGFRRGWVPV